MCVGRRLLQSVLSQLYFLNYQNKQRNQTLIEFFLRVLHIDWQTKASSSPGCVNYRIRLENTGNSKPLKQQEDNFKFCQHSTQATNSIYWAKLSIPFLLSRELTSKYILLSHVMKACFTELSCLIYQIPSLEGTDLVELTIVTTLYPHQHIQSCPPTLHCSHVMINCIKSSWKKK